MRKLLLLAALAICVSTLSAQVVNLWVKSAATANYPTFMGTGNTERGFATATVTLKPFTKIWERSAAGANYPSFMGTGNTARGLAFGRIGANDRVLLVERKISNFVYVLDVATGDSIARLDTTGFAAISSGTLRINDAEISADGVIYACNLSVGTGADTIFRVYRWANESATPELALSFVTKIRMGDKFTVVGSAADNSIVIWAAAAGNPKVFTFSTADNGATFTPATITLTGASLGSSPSVCPNANASEFYAKSNGQYLKRYLSDGTLQDSVSGTIVGTGSNALRYFEANGKKYLVVYAYGATNENARVIDVTTGLAGATLVGASPTLGTVANGNGTGDVSLKINGDNTVNVYVLGTNNGIGSYRLNPANFGIVERMYLVDRKVSNFVYVLTGATGDSINRLDTTGFAAISSGTLRINDAEVSADGVIYACNLAVGTGADTVFRVYRWSNESSAPQLALSYVTKIRSGDKFTVTGSTADNSIAIWAAGASSSTVVKFTTTDNGATFTPSVITLVGGNNLGSSPVVYPNTTGTEFYTNANGRYVTRYLTSGSVIDSLSGSIVGTGSNALRYFELAGKKYLAVYIYGAGNENANIVDVTNGLASALLVGKTPTLGSVSNGNGTGDVSIKANGDGTETIYLLGTNNGIGAYQFTPPSQVATPVIAPAGGTFNGPIWVKISVGTSNAKIYYTLNGTTPDSLTGTLFGATDSIHITDTATTTLKAIAYSPGMIASNVATEAYRILLQVATPTYAPPGGTYIGAIWVKLSVSTLNAKIYYTLNGSAPDSLTGTRFGVSDSIHITDTATTTVKAIAYAPGMAVSNVASAAYKIVILPASESLFSFWSRSKAAGTFPASFSTGNFERGMAYGKVGGKDRVYVVARTGGPKILIFDAMTGDSAGVILPNASVTGGTFPLNAMGVSGDGILFVGNLSVDVSTSAFKLYRWNTDHSPDTGKAVINYTDAALTGGRVGDMISVFGRASDNTLTIFAAVSGKDKVVKFTTADNGQSFTPTVLTLSNGALGTMPSVALATDQTLYVKSYAKQLYHYSAAGALIDSVSSAVIGTDVTNIRYFERLGKKYVACYYPNDGAPYTDERVTLVDLTNPAFPYVAFTSQSIGNVPNLNGTGAVDFMPLTGNDFLVFILGTNNGVAAFTNNSAVVVANLDTLFYGTTRNLLKNPYGSGYIVGTNGYGDIGKYERFDMSNGDAVGGFRFWFGYKKIVGAPDTVWLVTKTVKTVGSLAYPDSTTSQTLITSDNIDTTGVGNTFILPNRLKVNGPIFIGFEFSPTGNDTIALISDKNGEGGGANRAWEKFSDGNYNDFVGIVNPSFTWAIDVDLWIAAYYKKGNVVSVPRTVATGPLRYSLEQNYPNPFNPATTIRFTLQAKAHADLRVYNILGQQVAELVNQEMPAGTFDATFNAARLASGVYFYRLVANGADGVKYEAVKKLVLVK